MLTTGRVLQFDQIRGFGFIAAEDGGDDIFLHASVFNGDANMLVPGIRVEFQIMSGDRGRKSFGARLATDAAPPASTATQIAADDEQLCDFLSAPSFAQEITELLLTATPELTASQILNVRASLQEFAKKHGWSDG